MANQTYYPAHEWWKEDLEDDFQLMINPLLDDLGRRIKLVDLSSYILGNLTIYTDGTTIEGAGTQEDPLTVIGGGGGGSDTNFANTDLTLTESRYHQGNMNDLEYRDFATVLFEAGVFQLENSKLKITNSTSKFNSFITSGSQSVDLDYTLPTTFGGSNRVLLNNGAGVLSWVDASTLVTSNNLFTTNLNLGANRLHNLSTFDFQIGRTGHTLRTLDLNSVNTKLGFDDTEVQISNNLFDFNLSDGSTNNRFRFNNKGFHIFSHSTDGTLGIALYNNANSFSVTHYANGTLSADTDYIWNEDGNSGDVLTTDGLGNLTWNAITGFIPLSGTTVGNPMTGNFEIDDAVIIYPRPATGGFYLGDSTVASFQVTPSQLLFRSDNTSWEGVKYHTDYTANFVTRSLVDKGYVDSAIANTFAYETLTGSSVTNALSIAASSTRYLPVVFSGSFGTSTSSSWVSIKIAKGGILKFSNITTASVQPASGSIVYELCYGSTSSASLSTGITITVPAGSAAGEFSSANTFTIPDNTYLCWKVVNNATASSTVLSQITTTIQR